MARKYYRLPLTFTSAESVVDTSDWLEIVQPEWQEIDQGGFGGWLAAEGKTLPQVGGLAYIDALFRLMAEYRSHCDGDGCLDVELQIHRSRWDLPYRLVASYGELSEKYNHTGTVTESISVEMAESVTIRKSVVDQLAIGLSAIGDAAWEGAVYDQYGNELDVVPAISRNGSTYSWGQKLIGTLRVTYTERHDAYVLTIWPRDAGTYDPERPESAYVSTVRAFWGEARVETHEVDLPDMFGNCGGGGSVHVGGSGDDDDDDDETCYIHHIEVDPCTMEVLREWDEEVECPGEE